MLKKIAFVGVGLALLCAPLAASAQTSQSNPNAGLIALLTQLVQVLEQELTMLQSELSQGTVSASTSFTATPQSGAAPLSVSFTSGALNSNDSYEISFGDGTSGQANSTACNEVAGAGAACSYQLSHTYQSGGTYTATLYQSPQGLLGGFFGCNNGNCAGLALESVIITVTGTGSGTGAGTGTATSAAQNVLFIDSLTIGQAPLMAMFTAANLNANSSYAIAFGDGASGWISLICGAAGTTSCYGILEHAYTVPGTYTATLYLDSPNSPCTSFSNSQACLGQAIGTITITVSAASGGIQGSSFFATPTRGVAPLAVTFESDQGQTVVFGDGASGTLAQSQSSCVNSNAAFNPYNCYGSVQHTYTTPGNYEPELLDSNGNIIGGFIINVGNVGSTSFSPSDFNY